jgi:hypothetical protein
MYTQRSQNLHPRRDRPTDTRSRCWPANGPGWWTSTRTRLPHDVVWPETRVIAPRRPAQRRSRLRGICGRTGWTLSGRGSEVGLCGCSLRSGEKEHFRTIWPGLLYTRPNGRRGDAFLWSQSLLHCQTLAGESSQQEARDIVNSAAIWRMLRGLDRMDQMHKDD